MKLSKEERARLLALFEGLRVADVRDGMDWNMMHHYGSMSPDIRPLFRTRAIGIARTARYLPYQGSLPHMTPEEYTEWSGYYYNHICTYPWIEEIEDGDFIVIDQSGVNAGLMGSNNGLAAFVKGARGIVTNGGVRDTDELIIQKVPVWSKMISQGMVQGRLQFDAKDIPVNVGGVVVNPGDIVVADGDGVIVVPRDMAEQVAKYARRELLSDKAGRRKLYEEAGMELDDTVL
ncbi:MAG TPA: RraA family protein [Candidatus Atribacteria bacterium]|nr:RraA family protein [Candidatus Atribacteria bacterium]HPT78150.1 RraA family protein [Candidatus Atribacteria bacterium]